ncbi:MAG TPA: DNA polymerase III subunit delta' [Desulfatiglandales bacterium]|nr:DNA polymerase III subunit delta' [Desulfatiglandales bacterium]
MRSKLFKEIVGQNKAIAFLKKVIENNRIASAYLFTGIQGIGKTTTAIAFALLLNCMEPADGDGCMKCSSCKKIMDENHPDLFIIEPDREKTGIGIGQIREINRDLAFSPALGRYRIIIIDPVEKMTDEAANAFLKTLEEPPHHNIFILNVRDPNELLPTIVSRCQKVPFQPLPTEDIVNLLNKESNMDKKKAKIITRLSEGSLGKALKLAEEDLFKLRDTWLSMLNSIIDKPSDELLDLAQECIGFEKKVSSKDDRMSLMLGVWKSWYRDILLIKLGSTLDLILNSDLIKNLKELSSVYNVDGIMRSLAVISRAEYDLMSNKNLLLLLEQSLLKLKEAADL